MKIELTSQDILYPTRPYLARNKDIVDACTILIATPAQNSEIQRSGTWATVRYAKSKYDRSRIVIVRPDGTHYEA
jgi:hypothetical protein